MEGLCFSAGLGELLNPSAELEEFLVEREFGASLLNFYPCKLTSDERKTIDFLFLMTVLLIQTTEFHRSLGSVRWDFFIQGKRIPLLKKG